MDAGRINAGRIARGVMRGARASERGRRASERGARAVVGSLLISGQKTAENRQKSKNRATRPRALAAQARAMFFTNNTVKNDMNVSRETLSLLTVEKMCIFVVLFAVF